MRIVFFGTPDFTIPVLNSLFDGGYDLDCIVTAPDKESGRGRKLKYSPVKKFALEKSIKFLQPLKLRDEHFIETLKKIKPDIFIVVAFKILPPEVYTIPLKGAFNLHASLLPKYRGAAPIQWALINGEKETGLTTFFLKEKVDTGEIILQKRIKIDEEDDFGSLHDKLSVLGAEVVLNTVDLIISGNVVSTAQPDMYSTPAPKITSKMCELDFSKTAHEVHNLVRGLSPLPGAFFFSEGKRYKVYKTMVGNLRNLAPGQIIQSETGLSIGCKDCSLEVLLIQPEGKKRMSAEDFNRGYKI